jgi:hypothetical protein
LLGIIRCSASSIAKDIPDEKTLMRHVVIVPRLFTTLQVLDLG